MTIQLENSQNRIELKTIFIYNIVNCYNNFAIILFFKIRELKFNNICLFINNLHWSSFVDRRSLEGV